MTELIEKLGLDWRLLLTQAINFVIILVILRLTVYAPVLAILKKRKEKIAQGLEKAKRANQELEEARLAKAHALAQAHRESSDIVLRAQQKGKEQEAMIIADAQKKGDAVIAEAREQAERNAEVTRAHVLAEAETLVAQGIRSVVRARPEPFDQALIAEAVDALKKTLPHSHHNQ